MKAIPNSNDEKAIMKLNGNNPTIKNIIPELIILNVNPLNILRSICPDNIFAANLNPKETFLAKYEMNSIKTKDGNNANGHPAGTKKEKNLILCLLNPNIVAPNTIVKLKAKVKTK